MHRRVVAAVVTLMSTVWIPAAGAAPHLTSVAPASGPTAGGITMTLTGEGFGAAGNLVVIGASPCPVTLETTDHVECTLPPGSGASRLIRMVDSNGTSSAPFPFSYAAPTITDITAANMPTAGGVLITIAGTNFGAGGLDRRVTVYGPPSPQTCSGVTVDQEHVRITCTLPPGAGLDVPVDVIIDGQTSAPGSLSYDPPKITAISPARAPAASGYAITIRGENFGSAAAVTVGGVSCPIVEQGHTQLACRLPPNGAAPLDVRVTAGGQASNLLEFSYQAVASKCDAAKFKSAGSFAQCLANAQSKALKKGLDPDLASLAKCEEKFMASCTKAESKLDDCTRLATCASTVAAIHPEWVETVWNKQCVEKDTSVR